MEEIMLRKFKKENSEIYLEYLESCKANNWDTWNTTYKTYINSGLLYDSILEFMSENQANLKVEEKGDVIEVTYQGNDQDLHGQVHVRKI